MDRPWDVDPSATFERRLGKTAAEVGASRVGKDCPEFWELDNGDVAIIGRDATDTLGGRLPEGVGMAEDERIVVVPGAQFRSTVPDVVEE
ncbi:hypothetical protein [Streptomonospora salina]|uniref:Uncharacterized protein n=1 Tax=Streptomonospora salina TaxID=104205 RepID=A0A841E2M5_9ACTN|nr:hypothetical protein [Streptomonospora salina]MBB5997395.1 hypothetical protein [Streptomonospora salina]